MAPIPPGLLSPAAFPFPALPPLTGPLVLVAASAPGPPMPPGFQSPAAFAFTPSQAPPPATPLVPNPAPAAGPGRKQSGLGMAAFVGGVDLSGDILSFSKISGSLATLDVTPINKSAHVRIFGQRDGAVDFTTAFDPAPGQSHPVLAALPRGDVHVMACINLAVGGEGACQVAKEVEYNPTRANSGMLDAAVTSQANGFGLEWCKLLTPGLYTIGGVLAVPASAYDSGSQLPYGAQAYLQVTAFTGTDATVSVVDSPDASLWAPVAGLTFDRITAAQTTQRLATANTALVRRYLGVTVSTAAGFTSLSFVVAINRNPVGGVTF